MAKGSNGLKNNKLVFGSIFVIVIIVFVGALTMLQNVYQTETYYVLNQDVATKTMIVPEMLDPVVTSQGTAPVNALGIAEVQSGYLFSQHPLLAGDVLSASNVSGYEDIATGLPDEWVVTSFNVGANDAVSGYIGRGTYFDIMVTTADGSFYPFVNVLALDTNITFMGNSGADASSTEQYFVGMSAANAAKLQNLVQAHGGNIKLVLSPRANEYNRPNVAEYAGLFKYSEDEAFSPSDENVLAVFELPETPIWPGMPLDENGLPDNSRGEISDYTFSPFERDEFGRPIAKIANCGIGNARIPVDPETGECPEGLISNPTQAPSFSNNDYSPSIDNEEPSNEPADEPAVSTNSDEYANSDNSEQEDN